MTDTGTPRQQPTGLEIAMQWAELPAEHLQVALKALEPQLRREHELRMAEQKAATALDLERVRLGAKEEASKRTHTLYVVGLVVGSVIAVGMLAGAVIVGREGHGWLASLLAGPSLIALVSVFVLRHTDSSQTKAVASAQRAALAALTQTPPAVGDTGGTGSP